MGDLEALRVPEGSVLLHVGPYKTGSTAIQAAMFAARERLPDYGVEFPGSWRRILTPGYSVLGWAPRGFDQPKPEVWDSFARAVRGQRDSRVFVSTEDFGSVIDPSKASQIVHDLGADRVRVVTVARTLHRLLPSHWQEQIRNFDTRTYEQWLHEVLSGASRSDDYQDFWSSHDIAKTAAAWLPAVGSERFTVVVTDDSDRQLLPRTFEEMLGLPEGLLVLDENSNSSLTANATEALRRFNEVFAERDWPDELYLNLVQRGLMPGLREVRGGDVDGPIPPLPSWSVDRVKQLSRERVATIEGLGVHVVGDPSCLLTPDQPTAADEAYHPSVMSIDMALGGFVGFMEGAAKRDARRRQQARRRARSTSAGVVDPSSAIVAASSGAMLRELVRRLGRRARRQPPVA